MAISEAEQFAQPYLDLLLDEPESVVSRTDPAARYVQKEPNCRYSLRTPCGRPRAHASLFAGANTNPAPMRRTTRTYPYETRAASDLAF